MMTQKNILIMCHLSSEPLVLTVGFFPYLDAVPPHRSLIFSTFLLSQNLSSVMRIVVNLGWMMFSFSVSKIQCHRDES